MDGCKPVQRNTPINKSKFGKIESTCSCDSWIEKYIYRGNPRPHLNAGVNFIKKIDHGSFYRGEGY